jgi:hypothetical protein
MARPFFAVFSSVAIVTALGFSTVLATQSTPPADKPPAQPETVPAQPRVPDVVVRGEAVTLSLPVVGNAAGVKQWRVARVDRVENVLNSPDIIIHLRLADGTIVQVPGPAAPLDDLARQSGWVISPGKATATRNDYIERMVAFDVDANGRLIAMASLEPVQRNRNRLRRALGG